MNRFFFLIQFRTCKPIIGINTITSSVAGNEILIQPIMMPASSLHLVDLLKWEHTIIWKGVQEMLGCTKSF